MVRLSLYLLRRLHLEHVLHHVLERQWNVRDRLGVCAEGWDSTNRMARKRWLPHRGWLLKSQRLPRAIVFQCQLKRPGRTLRRNGHFHPQLLTGLEPGRVRGVLGNVKIHRLVEAHRIAGRVRPRSYIHALRALVSLRNADGQQPIVFHLELGAEMNGSLPDNVKAGLAGGAVAVARKDGVQRAGQCALAAVHGQLQAQIAATHG